MQSSSTASDRKKPVPATPLNTSANLAPDIYSPLYKYGDFLRYEQTATLSYAYSPICVCCGRTSPCFGQLNPIKPRVKKIGTSSSVYTTPRKASEGHCKSIMAPTAAAAASGMDDSEIRSSTIVCGPQETNQDIEECVKMREQLKKEIAKLRLKIEAEKLDLPKDCKQPNVGVLETLKEENKRLQQTKRRVEEAVEAASENMISRIKVLEEKRTREKEEAAAEIGWLKQVVHHEKGKGTRARKRGEQIVDLLEEKKCELSREIEQAKRKAQGGEAGYRKMIEETEQTLRKVYWLLHGRQKRRTASLGDFGTGAFANAVSNLTLMLMTYFGVSAMQQQSGQDEEDSAISSDKGINQCHQRGEDDV